MGVKTKVLFLVIVLLFYQGIVFAQTVKFASIAPEGTPWDKALRLLAQEWQQITKGKVRVKVYAGGIAGDEADMIRKMRIGQLQGGVFTSIGINQIAPEVMSLSLPFLINNDGELDFLIKNLMPDLETSIQEKGFKVLAWSKIGWIYFFSKKPVVYPGDLQKQILAVNASDAEVVQAWRALHFNVVPLSSNDILTSLQSGMVDAYYAIPLAAASFQWFALTKNMCNLKISPVIGAVIVSDKIWKRIPQIYRAELQAITQKLVADFYAETFALEKEAMDVMIKHGLIINQVPSQAANAWYSMIDKAYGVYIGKTFSRAWFNHVTQLLEEYRK